MHRPQFLHGSGLQMWSTAKNLIFLHLSDLPTSSRSIRIFSIHPNARCVKCKWFLCSIFNLPSFAFQRPTRSIYWLNPKKLKSLPPTKVNIEVDFGKVWMVARIWGVDQNSSYGTGSDSQAGGRCDPTGNSQIRFHPPSPAMNPTTIRPAWICWWCNQQPNKDEDEEEEEVIVRQMSNIYGEGNRRNLEGRWKRLRCLGGVCKRASLG